MGIVGLGYGYAIVGWRNSVRLPVGTLIEYLFDPQQRRIGKKVNGQLKQGLLYLGQLAPLVEQDSVGNIRSTFVYGTRPNVPEYMIRNGVRYRFVLDQVGSVRLAINLDDGTVAQRIDYDAFGRVTQNTNPGFQPFGYAGGLSDDDTKLVRFGVRDYDPETGRWTARDPVVSGGASSRYVYADNEPLGLYDPSGQWPRLVDVANFAAGFGDVMTFGLTNAIRDLIDANGTVNRCTLAYLGGAVAGIAAQIALGSALAAAEMASTTTVAQTGTELSTLRYTQPGEVFIRYESPALTTRITSGGGVTPGTFAAPISDGLVPVELRTGVYNLYGPEIRTDAYLLRPPPGTPIIGPRPVAGGTGNEVIFPNGHP